MCKRAAYIYFQSRKTVVILKIQEIVLTILIFHDLFCSRVIDRNTVTANDMTANREKKDWNHKDKEKSEENQDEVTYKVNIRASSSC